MKDMDETTTLEEVETAIDVVMGETRRKQCIIGKQTELWKYTNGYDPGGWQICRKNKAA